MAAKKKISKPLINNECAMDSEFSIETEEVYLFSFYFKDEMDFTEIFSKPVKTKSLVLDFRFQKDTAIRILEFILERCSLFVCHNLQAELKSLYRLGIDPEILRGRVVDTMIPFHVLDMESLKDLDTLCEVYLGDGKEGKVKDLLKTSSFNSSELKGYYGNDFFYTKREVEEPFIKYSRKDAFLQWELYLWLQNIQVPTKFTYGIAHVTPSMQGKNFFKSSFIDAYNLEMEYMWVLIEYFKNGVILDLDFLDNFKVESRVKIEELLTKLSQLCGRPVFVPQNRLITRGKNKGQFGLTKQEDGDGTVNFGSPQQLGRILYQDLGCPVITETKGGAPSTGKETLLALMGYDNVSQNAKDFIETIGNYRGYSKLISSFTGETIMSKVESDNRVRTHINSAMRTGRCSSSNPNFQQIPKRGFGKLLRQAFIAPEGMVVIRWDLNQIEFRLFAHFLEITKLIASYIKGDKDAHQETAEFIEEFLLKMKIKIKLERDHGKTTNFAQIYGQGLERFAGMLKLPLEIAKKIRDAYFAAMPEAKTGKDKICSFARQKKFVQLMDGRVRRLGTQAWKQDGSLERTAVNTLIQGNAAILFKLQQVNVIKAYKNDKRKPQFVFPVHDELVAYAWKDRAEKDFLKVKEIIENSYEFSLPIIAEGGIGNNWYEAIQDADKRAKKSIVSDKDEFYMEEDDE